MNSSGPTNKEKHLGNILIFNLQYYTLSDSYMYNCERFEPRSHSISTCRLSMIVWVKVILNRTVTADSDWRFDNLCGGHFQSQSELHQISWWYWTLVIDLIDQLNRDVIGGLSVAWHEKLVHDCAGWSCYTFIIGTFPTPILTYPSLSHLYGWPCLYVLIAVAMSSEAVPTEIYKNC